MRDRGENKVPDRVCIGRSGEQLQAVLPCCDRALEFSDLIDW